MWYYTRSRKMQLQLHFYMLMLWIVASRACNLSFGFESLPHALRGAPIMLGVTLSILGRLGSSFTMATRIRDSVASALAIIFVMKGCIQMMTFGSSNGSEHSGLSVAICQDSPNETLSPRFLVPALTATSGAIHGSYVRRPLHSFGLGLLQTISFGFILDMNMCLRSCVTCALAMGSFALGWVLTHWTIAKEWQRFLTDNAEPRNLGLRAGGAATQERVPRARPPTERHTIQRVDEPSLAPISAQNDTQPGGSHDTTQKRPSPTDLMPPPYTSNEAPHALDAGFGGTGPRTPPGTTHETVDAMTVVLCCTSCKRVLQLRLPRKSPDHFKHREVQRGVCLTKMRITGESLTAA